MLRGSFNIISLLVLAVFFSLAVATALAEVLWLEPDGLEQRLAVLVGVVVDLNDAAGGCAALRLRFLPCAAAVQVSPRQSQPRHDVVVATTGVAVDEYLLIGGQADRQ